MRTTDLRNWNKKRFHELYLTAVILVLFSLQLNAQVKVPVKIDTSRQKIASLYHFINAYMQQDTISNRFWHPKYKGREIYDYTMDWVWGSKTPKKISKMFDVSLSELQLVNDSLSYFKIMLSSRPDESGNTYSNVYKYYIVEKQGKYYLDNCKAYDLSRFIKISTKNIIFYISPFYKISPQKMQTASHQLEALYREMKRAHLTKPLVYFMCANEEELNNLSNIVVWDGGLGGFTNIPEGYVVAINKDPFYKHEFIHAILKSSANCFFLQEGIASLYGGLNKNTSFEQGRRQLKSCFQNGGCNFDQLYRREVSGQSGSNLIYAFAGVFCKYLIDNYGLDYFYTIYYDRVYTSENFLNRIVKKTGRSKAEIQKEVEKIILAN